MLHLILFLFFGAICVAGAVNLLVQSHPINSALSLIVVMASLAAEYLLARRGVCRRRAGHRLCGRDHGVVRLRHHALECGRRRTHQRQPRCHSLSAFPACALALFCVAWASAFEGIPTRLRIGALPGDPQAIARLLFHDFLLPFEVTSVLILIAIMGAVVLASRPEAIAHRPGKEATHKAPELVAAGRSVEMVPLSYYLVLSGFLFACGVIGFLIKRNIITIFMSIELMLNGVNFSFVAFAAQWHALSGQIFVFFVMVVAAAEAAVGLAIIIAVYRTRETLNVDQVNLLKL